MPRLTPILAVLTLLLATTLALAAPSPDAPTPELLEAIPSAWGQWPILVGLVVALVVRFWPWARGFVLERVPSQWRGAVAGGAALLFAALPMFCASLLAGESWAVAGGAFVVALLQAFAGAVGGAEGLRMALGKPVAPPPPAPPAPPAHVVLPVALVALLGLGGCSPSLARSAELGAARRSLGAPSVEQVEPHRCDRLSRTEQALRYVSVGAGTLAGGTGLATIPAEDDEGERALAISAAGLAVVAVTAEAVRAEVASDWASDCSE